MDQVRNRAVAFGSGARSGEIGRGYPPCFRVAWPPYRYLHLLFVRLNQRLSSSRLLLLAPMRAVERIVDLSRNPQVVQEHRELSGHGHRRSLLGVLLVSAGGYLLPVAPEVPRSEPKGPRT